MAPTNSARLLHPRKLPKLLHWRDFLPCAKSRLRLVCAWARLHAVDEAVRSSAQPSSGVVEIGGEMRAQVASIVTGAVDQRGFAAPQELHPHEVDAGRTDNAAVVRDVALTIENRQLQPGIVWSVTGGPNDRLDAALNEVHAERGRLLDAGRRQTIRRADRSIETVRVRPFVDQLEQAAHLEIGERAHVAQRAGELCLPILRDACETTNQPYADLGEGIEIEG